MQISSQHLGNFMILLFGATRTLQPDLQVYPRIDKCNNNSLTKHSFTKARIMKGMVNRRRFPPPHCPPTPFRNLWYREANQHPSLPWNLITHGFLDPSAFPEECLSNIYRREHQKRRTLGRGIADNDISETGVSERAKGTLIIEPRFFTPCESPTCEFSHRTQWNVAILQSPQRSSFQLRAQSWKRSWQWVPGAVQNVKTESTRGKKVVISTLFQLFWLIFNSVSNFAKLERTPLGGLKGRKWNGQFEVNPLKMAILSVPQREKLHVAGVENIGAH